MGSTVESGGPTCSTQPMANKELILGADMPLEQKASALLLCVAQELKSAMTRQIQTQGLSLLQLELLHALSYADKSTLTVNELKGAIVDDSPNVSRTLNKLVDAGYVEKQRSAADQRVVNIVITDDGRRAHREADAQLLKLSLGLSKKDLETLFRLLSKL